MVCNKKVLDIMTDHICSEVKSLIVSRPLISFLIEIKRNEFKAANTENAEVKKELKGK